jgi:RNA polymerase-interacting CarD/CdnL/TRCF family regulator
MPAVVRQSFEKADGELRAQAENALRDIQTNDLSAAFQDFTELNSKAKLSTEQHTLLARALTTLSQQLAEAAGQGDEQAAETLRQRLTTK